MEVSAPCFSAGHLRGDLLCDGVPGLCGVCLHQLRGHLHLSDEVQGLHPSQDTPADDKVFNNCNQGLYPSMDTPADDKVFNNCNQGLYPSMDTPADDKISITVH